MKDIAAMSPPKRPRGEKPATTIRFQRRQIFELGKTIADLRSKLEICTSAQSAAEARSDSLEKESEFLTEELTNAKRENIILTERLSHIAVNLEYYRGFHAGVTLNHVPTKTVTIRREGDSTAGTPGAQAGEEGRPQGISRIYEPAGKEIWRYRTLHPTDPETAAADWRTTGAATEFEIGEARDGTPHTRRDQGTDRGADRTVYRR